MPFSLEDKVEWVLVYLIVLWFITSGGLAFIFYRFNKDKNES